MTPSGLGVSIDLDNVTRLSEQISQTCGGSPTSPQDDPFLHSLSRKDLHSVHEVIEPPRTTHGFGLLPYNKKRRLYAGCVPTSEDFTVDSLRRAPNGCGNLPPREVLTVLLEENDCSLGTENSSSNVVNPSTDGASYGTDNRENACDTIKSAPCQPTKDFVCDASFRAECAQQAQIFAEKCRKRKWNVDEMSVVDSFMERLHLKMNEMTERLAQIDDFTSRRSGGSLEFLSTVFNNRPFLDVDRDHCAVAACFNTFYIYPQKSREAIQRKSFDTYVTNLREKLQAKFPQTQESSPPEPSQAQEPRKGDDESLFEKPSDEAPEITVESVKPRIEEVPSLSTPASPEELASEANPSSSTASNETSLPAESASRDVLSVLHNVEELEVVNKCIFEDPVISEFLREYGDEVPLDEVQITDLDQCEPPAAKRRKEEDEEVCTPSTSDHSSYTKRPDTNRPVMVSRIIRPSSSVQVGRVPVSSPGSDSVGENHVTSPRAIRTYRTSFPLRAEIMPNLDNIDIKEVTNEAVKNENVGYGDDDPFTHTSTSATKRPLFLRGAKKAVTNAATSSGSIEDPFSMTPVKNEIGIDEKAINSRALSSEKVFRATFSSLNDPASRSLTALYLKKPRVKWRLVPVNRAKVDTSLRQSSAVNEGDPRSGAQPRTSDSANAAAAAGTGVGEFEKLPSIWTKNFRKAPIRCIKENSSSDGIQRLPLRDLCRKTQYEAKGLTADMQLAWNRQKDQQANENDLIRQYKIPRWGSANPKRAQFPFDRTDGVFWPVVQPFDAIDLEDERHVTSADTRNQLICLSELTFASKLQLLCGRDDLFHRKRYMEAAEQDESKWQPGRFQHRIGYQRVVLKQSIDDARAKDIEQQKKEAAWMKRLVDLDAERISKTSGNPRDYQKADEPSSSAMIEHIEFNLVDEYSKKRNGSRGLRPALKVPKDWLEVDIAHYMTASQRKDYLCSYINYRNTLTYNHQPPKDSITGKEAVVNDELVQYHLNAVKAVFIHQSGYKAMGRSTLFSEEDQLSAGRRLEAISTTINREKLHLEDLTMLCELQEWEEKYWTIIWDNLINLYKNAYPLSELKLESYIDKAFREAARVVQRGEYCSRFWYHVDKVFPCPTG